MSLLYSHARNRDLAPTAQRLLKAARRVVMRRGYAGLSVKAVGAEAGVHESLIHYYFGSKAGLVEELVNSLVQDPGLAISDPPEGVWQSPVEVLLEAGHRTWANRNEVRLYNELLPHIVRSPKLRKHVAEQYDLVLQRHAEYLCRVTSLDPETCRGLSALGLALLDGLGLQATIDPERFDNPQVWDLWRDLIEAYLTVSRGG